MKNHECFKLEHEKSVQKYKNVWICIKGVYKISVKFNEV